MPNIILIFIVFALLFLGIAIYRKTAILISIILEKYDIFERLLTDIRDGTKTFYREKRAYLRVSDGITAKLLGEDTKEVIKVANISMGGVLLRTSSEFQKGQILTLSLNLPLFVQPVDVKAEVIRVAGEPRTKPRIFNVGIKFLGIDTMDREKLAETVNYLKKARF